MSLARSGNVAPRLARRRRSPLPRGAIDTSCRQIAPGRIPASARRIVRRSSRSPARSSPMAVVLLWLSVARLLLQRAGRNSGLETELGVGVAAAHRLFGMNRSSPRRPGAHGSSPGPSCLRALSSSITRVGWRRSRALRWNSAALVCRSSRLGDEDCLRGAYGGRARWSPNAGDTGLNDDTNLEVVRDGIILFLLLNEVRRRIVMRVYGVSRENSDWVTVIAIGSLAGGLHARATRVVRVPALPSVAAMAVGAGALKETAHGLAGDWSRTTPNFEALLAVAVLERSFGPLLRRSFRGLRRSSGRVRAGSRRLLAFVGGD